MWLELFLGKKPCRGKSEWFQLAGRVLVCVIYLASFRLTLYNLILMPFAISILIGYKTKFMAGVYIILGNYFKMTFKERPLIGRYAYSALAPSTMNPLILKLRKKLRSIIFISIHFGGTYVIIITIWLNSISFKIWVRLVDLCNCLFMEVENFQSMVELRTNRFFSYFK